MKFNVEIHTISQLARRRNLLRLNIRLVSRTASTLLLFGLFSIACISLASPESRYLADISQNFENNGLKAVLTPELRPTHLTSRPFVDQIYHKQNRAILLKLFSAGKDQRIGQRLEAKQNGFIYSIKLPTGTVSSFFFYRMSKKESQSYIDLIHKLVTSNRFPLTNLLIETAEAGEVNCSQRPNDVLFAVGDKVNQDTIESIAWTCASAAGGGVKNKAEETLDTLSPSNLSNLADVDLEKFWDESVKTYETLQELLPQLKPMLMELNHLLEQFHPKLKLNLLCSAVGSQVVDAITPGGVIKKIVILKSKIAGLKKLMDSLRALSKLYENFPRSKTLEKATQRIGACAL